MTFQQRLEDLEYRLDAVEQELAHIRQQEVEDHAVRKAVEEINDP